MACSSLEILSSHQECGEDMAMLPVDTQAADAASEGVGPGRPAFPSPVPNPSSKTSRSSSTGHQLPSWINAWAKPTVASSQLTDGVHLREFKARPLPSACTRRRTGLSSSTSGDAATAVAAAAMRPAVGPRATSSGRGASIPTDISDGVAGTAAGVSSVLLHFIRASSGPCGAMAAPPASSMQPRPLRTLRTSYNGSGGSGGGGGGAAGGCAGAASLGGSCAGARAGIGFGHCAGSAGFVNNSGCSGGAAAGAPRRRPMSAGPRQQPVSGTGGLVGPTAPDTEIVSPANGGSVATSYSKGLKSGNISTRPASASASRGGCIPGQNPSTAAAGSLRNRPASASGIGGARRSSAAPAAVAAAAAAVSAKCGGGREVAVPLNRCAAAAIDRMGLGPLDEDVGYKVAASDMLLAAGGSNAGGGAGAPGRGPCEGAAPLPLQHIPPAQHMLLSGSLQDLCERLARPGDRHLHLSLGSVSFSGDLDPGTGNMIQIQNRTVILHNCTLAFKPGQKLNVGSGGHVILADVIVVALAGAATAAECNGGGGGGGNKAAPTPHGAGRPPPSPQHHGNGTYTPRSRGGGGGRGASNLGLPLLHAADGGRLLLRGCCIKTVSAASVGSGGSGSGDGSATPVSPTGLVTPVRQRRTSAPTAAAATAPTGGGSGGVCGLAAPQILSILAEGGAAVEAIGCRLGSCAAVGEGTWLAFRRCRVKPSSADLATAAAAAPLMPQPLLRAVDGCTVEVSHSELCDGPMQGVAGAGAATRVTLSRSAVSGCRSHGALICHAAALTATACRLSGNGATGLTVRGRATSAELHDCEFSSNAASNLWIGGGSAVNLVSCAVLGSREGCGVALEGAGARLLAAACAFDGNTSCGVSVRQDAVVELRDCSSSGNTGSGLEVEGTVDPADNAELLAEATLACTAPPPPPLPEVFCLVSGGQLAKNGVHGCLVRRGGGLRVTAGCELSQNGGDGACADGVGCELLVDGCAALGNGESGLFVCSGAAVWADSCRLGGNMHGDVAVGGRGSRGRLVGCAFDYNPMTALRVHMGAKVALRRCTMEPRPAAAPATSRASHRLRQLRSAGSQRQGGSGGGSIAARAWTVDLVRSQSVQLRGRGSVLSVDGRAFFPSEEEGEPAHAAEAEAEAEAEGGLPQPQRDFTSWGGGMAEKVAVVVAEDDGGTRDGGAKEGAGGIMGDSGERTAELTREEVGREVRVKRSGTRSGTRDDMDGREAAKEADLGGAEGAAVPAGVGEKDCRAEVRSSKGGRTSS